MQEAEKNGVKILLKAFEEAMDDPAMDWLKISEWEKHTWGGGYKAGFKRASKNFIEVMEHIIGCKP